MNRIVERFIRYAKIDTQSDPKSTTSPSTNKQFDLAKLLKNEMEYIGLKNVTLSEKCYIMGTLPANTSQNLPKIGFIAHLDTSPEYTATNIKPKIIEHYDGNDIILNEQKHIVLSPKQFPELNNYIGQSLITTDGNTLLGADDKAGITAIMEAMEYLIDHPEIKHGDIKIAFTPDEEIGLGTQFFNLEKFNADFAYTIDGGKIGELEYENFNAAEAKITIHGRNVHPGTAKNIMLNALQIAFEINNFLPPNQRPEYTEGYEGFFHLTKLSGNVELAELEYIIRDHNKLEFDKKKNLIANAVFILNDRYGTDTIKIELKDTYYNMREKIMPVMEIVHLAERAMREAGIEPIIQPIRGGTDGAHLSYKGLPTPNIFTGGHNFHGKYEFLPVKSLEKAVEVIVNISKLTIQNN